MDLLIKNAEVYTVDRDDTILHNAWIAISDGIIVGIGPGGTGAFPAAERVIDAAGKAVFPGFVNTHIHIFQSLLKGLGSDLRLIEWLNASVLPYGERIGPELQYEAARLASAEALQSGCTTLCEFFYTTQSEELAHAVIAGMRELGIRTVFIRAFQDTGLEYGMPACFLEDAATAMKRTDRLMRTYRGSGDMLSIWTGPDVTWSTTREGYLTMLEYCRAEGMRYSMHIRETEVDDRMSGRYYGQDTVSLLDGIGFLSDKLLAVHCVNLNDQEIGLFAQRGVNVSHCPMANMILASGFAPTVKMRRMGINLSLGTDGAASNNTTNMLETLKAAALIQKGNYRDATAMTAKQILRAATIGGARAIGMEDRIGSLEVGKKADLFIFDPYQLTSFPMHDPLASLVYSSTVGNIETTIADGKIRYDHGVFAGMPEVGGMYRNIEKGLSELKRVL